MAVKAVQAFQIIEEYNIVLFNWYYKGFELLRRYLVKHGLEVDLENLDFKSIDKEMEPDEVTETTATNNENPTELEGEAPRLDGGKVPNA